MRALLALAAFAVSCGRAPDLVPEPPASLASPSTMGPQAAPNPGLLRSPAPPAATPPPAAAEQLPAAVYPWLASVDPPAGSLDARFEPPPGFTRAPVQPGSFGAWLRTLPLMPAGTPVRSHRGGVILPPDHDNLAAVVAIDVGTGDLQQCADSIIRLHAEWLFSQGRRDQSYRAASGAAMPFARWARGERMKASGLTFEWVPSAKPDDGHASFRKWLDGVFSYANTGSLARDTEGVAEADLRPGDFVVQAGAPGHAVLVLDMARAADGRRALLLGQGFMPAQSFQVLRPSAARGPWFVVDPGATGLDTPFWPAFPWKALHRFPAT